MEGPMTPPIEGLIEEGEAFNRLRAHAQRERVSVIVIGTSLMFTQYQPCSPSNGATSEP